MTFTPLAPAPSNRAPGDTSVTGDNNANAAAIGHLNDRLVGLFGAELMLNAKDPAFGAVGDGGADDTAALQSAIDEAVAQGRPLYIPPGVYRVTAELTLGSDLVLAGAGKGLTVIDMAPMGATLIDRKTCMSAQGALGGSTALNADASRGDKSVSFASAPAGWAVGDTVLLSSDAVFGTTGSLKRGEMKRIEAISAGTVTFEDVLYDSYLTVDAAKAAKFTTLTRNVTIAGLTIRGTDDDNMERGVYFYGADGVTVKDCEFLYTDWNSINLRQVVNFDVVGNDFRNVDWVDNLPNYYGLTVENASAHGLFANNHGAKCRHLFTTGYTTTEPGVTRFVTVQGNVDTYSQSASYDTHDGSEFVSFIGNTSSYSESAGLNCEGPEALVEGNIVNGYTNYGIHIRQGARNVTVRGNRITGAVSPTNATGIWVRKTDAAHRPSRIKVEGNIVEASTTPIRLNETDDCSVADNDILEGHSSISIRLTSCIKTKVSNNTGAATSAAFVYLEDSTGTRIVGNDSGAAAHGVRMAGTTVDNTLIVGNDFLDATAAFYNLMGVRKIAHNLGDATHDL